MKKIMALMVLSVIAASAVAESVPFTYNFSDSTPEGYRKFKSKPEHDSETIDVAIFIDGSFAGKKVTSLSVPIIGDVSVLRNLGAFMTTKLTTRNQGAQKINDPDICAVEANLEGNMLTATFAEPYTVTDKGVYVGYSVTDTSMQAMPVAVVDGYADGAFWYRGSEANAKWADLGKSLGKSSALTVTLEGDYALYNVKLSDLEDAYAAVGEVCFIEAELNNFGMKPIKSLGYTVNLNGEKVSRDITLPVEIPSVMGLPFSASLELPAVNALGEYEVEVSIDKINGEPNVSSNKSCRADVDVLPFVPKNNPLIEEYTGLRCGYCPRGYVMLNQMRDKYGIENFVAISYHCMLESGCMVHLKEFPWSPSGIPAGQINRSVSPGVSEIPAAFVDMRRKIAPAEVAVNLAWNDDAKTEMVATAKTRFLEDDDDSPYLISFCVVADGLSSPNWIQKNTYAEQSAEENAGLTGDYWNLFIGENASPDVSGLVFDDIAVLYPDQQGVTGSLPGVVKGGEWYESIFIFRPQDIVNVRDQHVINDINKLRVIAIINDTENKTVVNSASSLYVDGTGRVDDISVEEGDGEAVYYNLNGVRVNELTRGVFVKVQNGKAVKIVR